MSRKKLKPVTLQLQLGNNKYKKTVYGRHIRFSFLPGHLFVLHPDIHSNFTLTHFKTGLSVSAGFEYGSCLYVAKKRIQKAIQSEPFNHLARRSKRYKRK